MEHLDNAVLDIGQVFGSDNLKGKDGNGFHLFGLGNC
jgi:hypothetical protein